MKTEIKKHVETLFEAAPKTRSSYELKEELLSNSYERYFDLVEDGIPENEALNIVINSIGEIDQLFPELNTTPEYVMSSETTKKIALYKSVAIGLYILAIIAGLAVEEFTVFDTLAQLIGFSIAGLATCILVYTNTAYPKYNKKDETIVEEFKEWNSNNKNNKAVKSSISTIIWMIVLVLYFVLSFVTSAWYITWVIFLIGICAQAICNLMFQLKE